MAAAPGTSQHEKGHAFDLQASDPSRQGELRDIGATLGLKTLGPKDPNHFELTSWDNSNETAHPGISNSRFLQALQHFESSGSNIPNVHQTTSSGQAQGYNQITTGTWKDFGGLQFAPDALHATKEQQDLVASKIPMRRWAPETLTYLKQQGFNVDPNKTLGENIAMNGGTVPTGATGGAPQNSGDWQALLGAEAPPEFGDLGSMMGDAVSGPSSAGQDLSPDPSPPPPEQFDQSYALASPQVEELGARYAAAKPTRKLSPLGQLFTLPTIGQPKQPQQTQPTSMGIG
jgi:hypothetical protein